MAGETDDDELSLRLAVEALVSLSGDLVLILNQLSPTMVEAALETRRTMLREQEAAPPDPADPTREQRNRSVIELIESVIRT